MKVFYYCNFPSPYYVGFLNELGKLCELTAVFERGSSNDRDDSWKQFSAPNVKNLIILHGIHTAPEYAFCPQIIGILNREKFNAVIVHDPASPTGLWLIGYLKLKKIPFAFQCEGGFPGDGKTGLKEKFKRALFSGAQLYLSAPGPEHCYFKAYGAPDSRLVYYPFASFYQRDILERPKSPEEKQAIREELGIEEEQVIVSVGRIIPSKGYDTLLDAIKDLPEKVGTYIVSGPATEELQRRMDGYGLKNVHFVDFMPKEQLWKYYQMADFLVLPTRYDSWGLFVNEAMANGLPVITTKQCAAGLDLIVDGENGYLVNADDAPSLTEKINRLLSHPEEREKMAWNNIQKIQPYSFEQQAAVTIQALNQFFPTEQPKQ